MAKTKKHYSIRAYMSYLKRYKFSFLLVVFVFLIANGALAVIPVFVGQLVSALAATPVDRNGAYLFAGLLIASSVGNHITWHIAEFLYLKLIIRRNHEIGNLLFKAAIEKPYPYFIGKFTGKISSYVTQLTQEYWEFIFTSASTTYLRWSSYRLSRPSCLASTYIQEQFSCCRHA